MELVGYLSLIIMGTTLSLVGAGGSILTIPILVYLFGMEIIPATSYSLMIVGCSALFATVRYRHYIYFKKAINFTIPSVFGVFGARYFVICNLPNALFGFSVNKILIILLLMFIGSAGYFMIKKPIYCNNLHLNNSSYKYIKVAIMALILGIIMGILGAGGGFLIIPTLVLIMGVTMQEAVPTSLFIVTINSFVGFIADKHHLITSDWNSLLRYLVCAFLGMLIGMYATKFIKGKNLKLFFGYFVWIVGIAIFTKEFIL